MEHQQTGSDGEITQLLHRWGDGRHEAFRKLLPLAYSRQVDPATHLSHLTRFVSERHIGRWARRR